MQSNYAFRNRACSCFVFIPIQTAAMKIPGERRNIPTDKTNHNYGTSLFLFAKKEREIWISYNNIYIKFFTFTWMCSFLWWALFSFDLINQFKFAPSSFFRNLWRNNHERVRGSSITNQLWQQQKINTVGQCYGMTCLSNEDDQLTWRNIDVNCRSLTIKNMLT